MKHLKLYECFLNEVQETFYPNSGLHPVAQASVHRAFEDLKKRYPKLTDTDCRKDDKDSIRLYYKFKGKEMSSLLNMNGDTYTKVMQDVKRRIDPPVQNKARFIRY